MSNLVCIAKILKPHGVRGYVKLASFAANPLDVFHYPCLYDEQGKEYTIKLISKNKDFFIVSFNNNQSRNVAEEYPGLKLYVQREALPQVKDDEIYYADLVGIEILDSNKNKKGVVVAVCNFGAGEILEMQLTNDNNTIYLPFQNEYIEQIDINNKTLIFNFQKAGI